MENRLHKPFYTLEDLMSYYDSTANGTHFMGAVVLIPVQMVPVGVSKHLVIDGQQRLTTVSIVLTVLRDLMDTSSADRVNDYLVNRHYQGPDRLKLLPTQADGDQIVYKQLVVDRTMPAPAGESFIKPAYDYFKRKMQGDHDGKPVEPGRVLEIIEQRLEVVLISLGQGDDPYLIFESLNAKGQKLTQADLVRNYILMKFGHSLEPGGEQERIYESYWKPLEESLKDKEPKYWLTTFLRHFCMKDGTSVQKDAVYSGGVVACFETNS